MNIIWIYRNQIASLAFTILILANALQLHAADPAILKTEFIFETAPFKSCHASTIVESTGGLVAAWFGGTREGASDVGIWLSRLENGSWSAPVQVASGADADGKPLPCWNPVLFQPVGKDLLLFYKVGPSPSTWWGKMMSSSDSGKTWSPQRRLPEGILGPIKDKPVALSDGTLLCGSSTEGPDGWRIHIERTMDLGKTWLATPPLNDGRRIGAIQPTILVHHDPDSIQILCRTRQGRIYDAWSKDAGQTWSAMAPTPLPNPNSGIDAVQLRDGRSLVVYNHTPRGRSPLNLAISEDGKSWKSGPILETEPGEFSYPAIIQAADGMVHITYTWKREKVRHVVIDPAVASRGCDPITEMPRPDRIAGAMKRENVKRDSHVSRLSPFTSSRFISNLQIRERCETR
ncbi:MAG TPA: sialidase family protein [Humisphaera sp.]|jgi:predicted neuraminidase|nr:sialidase family protein [Humisphaera sp.]